MAKLKKTSWLVLRTVYALTIVAALGFGAGSLHAVQTQECPYDGYTWVGECDNQEYCEFLCLSHGGYDWQCRFTAELPGCCVCMQ